NRQNGVWIRNGAAFNIVGSGPLRNLISGNTWSGVALTDSGTIANEVVGNNIGVNAAGTAALGNGVGVFVGQGARLNSVGTPVAGGQNVIAGNRNQGVALTDVGTENNSARGNFIGPNVAGTAAVPNQQDGVWIGNGARDNSVGGSTAAARNVISGNNWSGVALFHTGTTGNAVQGNFIGTTPTGNAPLGN